jgi:hypothetical protein
MLKSGGEADLPSIAREAANPPFNSVRGGSRRSARDAKDNRRSRNYLICCLELGSFRLAHTHIF